MTPRLARRVRVRAHAKVNTVLRVLGLREDGYHELQTVFRALALHDTLTVTEDDGPLRVTADDPGCPTDEDNLVWRAATAVWRASGRRGAPSGVRCHLTKRLPMQAGLGGGSSDAAAALRALSRLWAPRLAETSLHAIARTLGADVPFFLLGGTALGVQRGDVVYTVAEPPRHWVVLVRPRRGVSTAEAFGWWDADTAAVRACGLLPAATVVTDPSAVVNDLEAPVRARRPEVGRLLARLRRAGATAVAMSGSGSAVFALVATRASAVALADAMRGAGQDVWVTRTLSAQEYQRASAPRLL